MRSHFCQQYNGEHWRRGADRSKQFATRLSDLRKGVPFVCEQNNLLVAHKGTHPKAYVSSKMFCNMCNKQFNPEKEQRGQKTTFFRCAEPCECNFDICEDCMGCSNKHPLEKWTTNPAIWSVLHVKCNKCNTFIDHLEQGYYRCGK